MPVTALELQLRQIARDRIAKGTLPCKLPQHIWATRGSEKLCALCAKPIGAHEVEYEMEYLGGEFETHTVFRFHVICQASWQLECAQQAPVRDAVSPTA
ncbi:MAG: hypothetical protein JOZ93_09050 [Sinobacteraceae bacterium]|nr:hypothetical protein [Nevskiaceae bacterium]MBV9912714.1 hypothetical protein [Nevskiaceae bacterium]